MRALAVLAAALVCIATLALACGSSGGGGGEATPEASPGATPATPPEEALRIYVERRLLTGFVADCDEAVRPDDVGKQCARFLAERSGLRAYELGPTFSEYNRIIILKAAAGTWTIVKAETRDPDAATPGIPWPIEVGATLVVAGTEPQCLRLRDRPGLQAPEVGCLDDGTAVTVVSGPVLIDDFEWWQLEGYGWAASNWLRYPDEAPVATATPEGG